MRSRRAAAAARLACACACAMALALASAGPARAADATPEQLQFAAQEHDLGYRAYTAKNYDEAATHFENAFFAAPNPAELRSAIRARRDAGQAARAATLSAIGQRKFPDDAGVNKTADETITAVRGKIYEVKITSTEECNVAVDSKIVAAEKAKAFRFFVDPGKHDLLVGWSDDRSKHVSIDATAGGSQALDLTAPPVPPKPPPGGGGGGGGGPPPSSKPFGPAVFLVGAGLTAVGVGVTIWSGIDTQNNPGPNAVKADCAGQGTNCPQYQQGLSSQLRTNVLIGATAGVGAVTAVIGIFFTQWSHADTGAPTGKETGGLHLTPVLGLGRGAVGGVAGTF
jgi:opacity protein-like surface antigen